MKLMNRNPLLFLAVPLLFAAAVPASRAYDLSPGQPFPKIVLPTVGKGEPLSLADFRGEKVMLHLFASW